MTAAILILGGTGEARALAQALHSDSLNPDYRVITSLAGATLSPRALAGEVRTGGFGGPAGLATYLTENAISYLVDATHPYAARMGTNAAEAARTTGVPLLRLARPAWIQKPDDHWIEFDSTDTLATGLPTLGRRAFLTLGGADLNAFAGLVDVHLTIRAIDRPDPMPALSDFEMILSAGPFDFASEVALLSDHRIDVVISRNAGGDATYAKIEAARHLSLPVAMLARPRRPAVSEVASVKEAVQRIRAAISSLK